MPILLRTAQNVFRFVCKVQTSLIRQTGEMQDTSTIELVNADFTFRSMACVITASYAYSRN